MPERDPGWRDPIRGERVAFPGRRGNMLIGDLHRPGDVCGPALVLCHGMESTRGGTKQTAIVERFVPRGFTVLRFDFSYVGESDGRFEDMTISGEVDDALGALDFIAEYSPPSCILVGSSLGGAVALLAAAQAPGLVNGVATIAAVGDAAIFTDGLSREEMEQWQQRGQRRWRDGHMNSTFLEDIKGLDILAAVARITQPLLVMHGEGDDVVPFRHARQIAAAAAGDVRLQAFPGVGHRFEEPGALENLLETLESWLSDVVGEVTGA